MNYGLEPSNHKSEVINHKFSLQSRVEIASVFCASLRAMRMRCAGLGWLTALLLAGLAGGCGKSEPGSKQAREGQALKPQTVLRMHWLGKDKIAADTNSASLMGVWRMVETAKIEAQTLDKLAQALAGTLPPPDQGSEVRVPEPAERDGAMSNRVPHSLSGSQPPATSNQLSAINYPLSTNASVLRPLLDDLVLQESYLEVRHATNQPPECALAIRLNDQRAGLWAAKLDDYRKTRSPERRSQTMDRLQVMRAAQWTVVGLAARDPNGVVSDLVARIQSTGLPYSSFEHSSPTALQLSSNPSLQSSSPSTHPGTNWWLEVELDPAGLWQAAKDWRRDSATPPVPSGSKAGPHVPGGLPLLSLGVTGEGGENVRTVVRLKFREALGLELEPWNVPTNLLREPLVSFTALRGVRPWLQAWKGWSRFDIKPAPNQVFFWGQRGAPFLTCVAAPVPGASNAVWNLTRFLEQQGNPWLAANSDGIFVPATNFTGTLWANLGFMVPFVESASTNGSEFIWGGLTRVIRPKAEPAPAELLGQLNRTNLVAYEWELTETRAEQWIFNGQFLRMTMRKAQLPAKSAAIAWFRNAAPKLGNCVSLITQTGPDELSFTRRSTMGLTGVELHLLADWLESPQFPCGLHTLLAPARYPARPQGTNAAGAVHRIIRPSRGNVPSPPLPPNPGP